MIPLAGITALAAGRHPEVPDVDRLEHFCPDFLRRVRSRGVAVGR